jgi:PST family polysaccharide transporter
MVAREPARLQRVYQNASTAIVAVGLPLMAWQSTQAEPLVRLLLGDKWLGAIFMLHWLAISLIPAFFGIALVPLSMAMDQTKQLAWRNFVQFCFKLPSVIIGALLFGFAGVVAARIISETAGAIYCMMIAKRLLHLTVSSQFLSCWRSIVSTCVMTGVLNLCTHLSDFGTSSLMLVLRLGFTGILSAAVYSGTLLLLWLAAGKPSGAEATAVRMMSFYWQRLGRRSIETGTS